MTHPPKRQDLAASRQRRVARLSPVAAATSVFVLSCSWAQAQSTDPAEPSQTVTVTGIRRSVETSVATKRNADGIVEAVSAEDIGKLPDVSIAESLARLPGLTGQRVGGRAQSIQIRGLAEGFGATLLNGRPQVTTGDNRSVEYDQFPSELIYSATVHKTADASLAGQGLSGTINLKSVRPLDFRGRTVTLNARAERNSNGELNAGISANGNRFSASYIDQFADNTVGVALGIAHLDSPGQELHYKAWSWGVNNDCIAHPEWGCQVPTGVATTDKVLGGFEVTAVSRKQKRDGLMAVLEFKPNKDLHSTVDLYYSKFSKDETVRGLFGGGNEGWGGAPGAAFTNVGLANVGGSQIVTSGHVDHVNGTDFVVRNDLNTRKDKLTSLGWNLEYKLADKLKGIADLSYSRADRKENVIETYAGVNPATIASFDFNLPTAGGFPKLVPGLNYADAAQVQLSDPAGWGHEGLWKKPKVKDVMKSLRLELQRDLDGFLSRVDAGMHYAERRKDREMNEVEIELAGDLTNLPVPANLLVPTTSLSQYGIPGVLSYDVQAALNTPGLYTFPAQALNEIINRNYDVTERVTTFFSKFSFDGSFGAVPVRGNFGLQWVHTQQESNGYARMGDVSPANAPQKVTQGTSFDDLLPSANLVMELSKDSMLRFGAGMSLARPRMDDMRAGANVSVSNAVPPKWSGDGGNPKLEPWRAWSYDVSWEKYLGKRSYLSTAVFYKDLETYIYKQSNEFYDFTGYPNNTPRVPLSSIGTFTQPMNGTGGHIWGLELAASLDAGLWNKSLDGLGLIASFSRTLTSIKPNGPGTDVKLEGLSGKVANLTAYYERGGFSARISQRYRSAFRGEITSLHNARDFTEILADRQTDLQVGYAFDDGPMKGLSLLLQVNNVTDSPYATRHGNGFSGSAYAPQEYNKYGRQTLLGVTYKF